MNSEKLDSDSPYHKRDDEDRAVLPGFRFHPTDEELVGFYLRRKVEKKPPVMDLIREVDVYKYDPWYLPTSTIGDKEWYFFCMRGRKYRNSVRPNRVTGSGFWKATGIDKPIYSTRDRQDCIGLKKSLVYYRGSAGKGTKTDWMMHEFRLPPSSAKRACPSISSTNDNFPQEAEVWTICRILKRMALHRKSTSTVKDSGNMVNNGKGNHPADSSSKTSSYDSGYTEQCVSLGDSSIHQPTETRKPNIIMRVIDERRHAFMDPLTSLFPLQEPLTVPAYNYPPSSFWNVNGEQDFHYNQGNWDELRLVVERAIDPSFANDCRQIPPHHHDTLL